MSRWSGGPRSPWRVALTRSALLWVYACVGSPWSRRDVAYVLRNAVMGAALLGDARRRGTSWEALGLDPRHLPRAARWGGVAALVALAGVGVAATGGARTAVGRGLLSDRRAARSRPALLRQVLVRIPLGTAVFEEVAFRGVVFAAFDEAGGRRAAVAGSSVAFGLWHIAPTLVALRDNAVDRGRGRVTAVAVALTTVAGAALALLRVAGRHVLACVLAHWAVNAAGLVAAATWRQRQPRTAQR